jgi:type IV secretory pathway TraG/TraD family ATPase VirD4
MTWSPLHGCKTWSNALRQAQWLADATAHGDSEIARYWRGEAAKLLAPMLHAAALAKKDVTEVLAWIDRQDVATPARQLLAAETREAWEAERQLKAVDNLDDRNRGTTYMSAASVLAGYRYPEVRATAEDDEFTAGKFLRSPHDTLFVIAAERHQRLLTPLVVTLLSSLIHEAIESGTFVGDRRLRVLLDEAANIAPLQDLPRLLSQAAGHGIRMATVWQSVAQIEERHGRGAATIMANSTNKLFLGPVTDDATRKFLMSLLGEDRRHDQRRRPAVPKAGAATLQQLSGERALLVVGDRPPAVVALTPYWAQRDRSSSAAPRWLRWRSSM